jgi:hypothetical protein
MADDTGNPLDSNTNDQPDPPTEIIPVEDTETITPIQQTENMEVHKHPHHVTHKKKWGEYLLEFFMLFLAVFLGFVAENIREHSVEKEKEKHYIESLVNDLRSDTSEMSYILTNQRYDIAEMDSALSIPISRLHNISIQDTFYHHFVYFYSWVFIFFQHDNTLSQLKNAGGFSVLHNKMIVDSIGDLQLWYEQQVKLNGNYYNDFWRKVEDLGAHVMIMPEPPTWASDTLYKFYPHAEVFTQYDTPLLQELYSWIRNEKGTLLVYMDYEKQYIDKALKLIHLINKEYQLNN